MLPVYWPPLTWVSNPGNLGTYNLCRDGFVKKIALLLGVLTVLLLTVMLIRAQTVYEEQQAPALELARQPALDEQAAVGRLSRAIGIPTVSYDDRSRFDAEAFLAFHQFLQDAYPQVHAIAERDLVNTYSLVFHLPGSNPNLAPILLMGHYDVVPIDPASQDQWRFEPFSGVLSDGHIWGRGSMDDKLGVIGLMEAMEQLLANGFRPQRSIYLAFGHDEEVGGLDGAIEVARWFEQRGVRFEFVLDEGGIVTEGIFDGVDRPVAVVGIAEKGWVNLELTVRSIGGHSSQPPQHTAVGILSEAIVRLENDPFPASLEYTRQTIDTIAHAMPFGLRFLFANSWLLEPLIKAQMLKDPGNAAGLRTTTAVTMISGSPKSNILPTEARAVANFRIIPGETAESVRQRVVQVIDDPRVEINMLTHWDPSAVSPVDSEAYRLIAGTIRGIDPDILVAPYMVRGGTDARYFNGLSDNVYRFLMARANPKTIEQIHGINEHVAVESYLEAIRFYYQLISYTAEE